MLCRWEAEGSNSSNWGEVVPLRSLKPSVTGQTPAQRKRIWAAAAWVPSAHEDHQWLVTSSSGGAPDCCLAELACIVVDL